MLDMHDDIIKAQSLFNKMVCSCGPKCFKKLFTEAIQLHTLDEFYPVVMQAELTAALALSAKARQQDNSFDFGDYLESHFGLRPRHLINLAVDNVANIMEKPVYVVEDILRDLGFTLHQGRVTAHPDMQVRKTPMQRLSDRIKKTGTQG